MNKIKRIICSSEETFTSLPFISCPLPARSSLFFSENFLARPLFSLTDREKV